jgi:hypothetical protein
MRTLSAIALFSAAAVITACYVQQPPPQQPYPQQGQQRGQQPVGQNQGYGAPMTQASGLQPGTYACNFKSGGFQYADFACVVSQGADGRMTLEKVNGSQRIRGTVAPFQGGFDFNGTFFCPYGSCTENSSARFIEQNGTFVGSLSHSSGAIVVTLKPAAFGGQGYGGSTYGGATYGGRGYGGRGYGGRGFRR